MESKEGLLNHAISLEDEGRCREAIEIYESLAEENPIVLGSIGHIYHIGCGDVARDIGKAISFYERALDRAASVSISRALITAYVERGFTGVEGCEDYLERIAASSDTVSQLASLWLFALRFRRERSPKEQDQGRAFGEKAAQMGNVHACKAMAEVYLKEGSFLKSARMSIRASLSKFWLRLVNAEDIRLQKY